MPLTDPYGLLQTIQNTDVYISRDAQTDPDGQTDRRNGRKDEWTMNSGTTQYFMPTEPSVA